MTEENKNQGCRKELPFFNCLKSNICGDDFLCPKCKEQQNQNSQRENKKSSSESFGVKKQEAFDLTSLPENLVNDDTADTPQGLEVSKIIDEIKDYGQELRNDWSDFDGRDAKRKLDDISERLEKAISRTLQLCKEKEYEGVREKRDMEFKKLGKQEAQDIFIKNVG